MKTTQSHASQTVAVLAIIAGMWSMQTHAEDWIESAAKKIEISIDDSKNNVLLAESMLNLTHPTGKNPVIASVETARGINGNALTITITLNWNGGFTNANYQTVVTWKCNQFKHISAIVTGDNSAFGVSTENRLRLNTYFQGLFDALFPAERK